MVSDISLSIPLLKALAEWGFTGVLNSIRNQNIERGILQCTLLEYPLIIILVFTSET